MGVTVSWDNAARSAMRITFEGRWTWDEFHATREQRNAMLESVAHMVDVIMNLERTDWLPTGSVPHLQRMASERHPRSGVVVVVSASAVLRGLYDVVSRVSVAKSIPVQFVETLTQARAALGVQQPGVR